MNKQAQYIKCPRCELNYIMKKDKFCDVCKAEMKAGILEENELDELDEDLDLCPICRVNYIQDGETMCSTCLEEQAESGDLNKDEEPDWRGFVDKADDEDEELDLLPVEEDDEIDEELEGAFAKDLENEFDDEEEEYEEESIDDDDDFDLIDDDDFDDDDEDDEEDDDEDDDDDLY